MEIEVEPNWNPHFLKNRIELHGNSIIIADPIAFGGISQYYIQSVLNAGARLIMRKRKYDHITSTLRDDLHWLPIRQRIL